MRAPPEAPNQLLALTAELARRDQRVDVVRWCDRVDLGIHRMAFLVGNDLVVALGLIGTEPQVIGGPTPQEKANELLQYAISEPYFALREHLGW